MIELGFWEAFFASDAWLLIAVGLILGTFDKLLDWIAAGVSHLQFMFIIDPYEEGVVLRLGKYNRTVVEGWHFVAPFGIERIIKDTVVRRTAYLSVQSLTSKDGKAVNLSPIVIYKIRNIRRWELEVDDASDAIRDITYGLNDQLCSETLWKDVYTQEYAEELTRLVKKDGTDWGAFVVKVKFSDRAQSRSMRIWTGDGMTGSGEEYGE